MLILKTKVLLQFTTIGKELSIIPNYQYCGNKKESLALFLSTWQCISLISILIVFRIKTKVKDIQFFISYFKPEAKHVELKFREGLCGEPGIALGVG